MCLSLVEPPRARRQNRQTTTFRRLARAPGQLAAATERAAWPAAATGGGTSMALLAALCFRGLMNKFRQ